jgi:type IV pilus assembly protein PilB
MSTSRRQIGELLIEMGVLNKDAAERVAAHAAKTGKRFGEAAVELRMVTNDDVKHALAAQHADQAELLDMDRIPFDTAWAMRVPAALATRRQVLPFAAEGQTLLVACADIGDQAALDAVERATGMKVFARRAEPESLRRALQRVYPEGVAAGGSGAVPSVSGVFTAMPSATGTTGAFPIVSATGFTGNFPAMPGPAGRPAKPAAPVPEGEALDLDRIRIDPAWALKVPATLALRRQVLPFAAEGKTLYVACADPGDQVALEAVERATGLKVLARRAEPESLRRALQRVYPDAASRPSTAVPALGKPGGDDDDAVAASEDVLRAAMLRQASDIHLEPAREGLRIRFRVDGVLEEYKRLPPARQAGILSRFKVLGGLDIAEKRAAQDGGFTWRFGPPGKTQRAVDIRMATLPTKYGERLTMRLLALQTESLTLENLGFQTGDLDRFTDALAKPHGIILVTGPTGSGKSTTLYAAIRTMDRDKINVLTIEDPIEYEIAGVSQVEVDSADKVTFSKALRSALRHDPDVLMVGEIRDKDTADVAIKASLTGHLVLSTLHTNSAVSSVTRLIDMGVPEYLVAATLRLAVAQRLVRRLCKSCKKPRELTPAEAASIGRPASVGATVYDKGGCAYCGGRGVSGRVGVFEILSPDPELAAMITARASEADINSAAMKKGMRTLMADAADKILSGQISVQEALDTVERI